MSQWFQLDHHIMVTANYCNPKPHSHLASHLILSLNQEMHWVIEGENVNCKGILIGPNVVHYAETILNGSEHQESTVLVLLFPKLSLYEQSLQEHFLKGNSYAVLDDQLIQCMVDRYHSMEVQMNGKEGHWNAELVERLDQDLLQSCRIEKQTTFPYDERVVEMIRYIEGLDTVPADLVDQLSSHLYLSKSRISHLFRQETGMTLHSYLAFEKMRKFGRYLKQGNNITDSCIQAGFDSSSHLAATAQRMFGMSLSAFLK